MNPLTTSRATLLALALTVAPTSPLAAQSVDHTSWQTPAKSQGDRTTCITFSAVAALEARYKRLGQDLDLSEEFVNYLRKMFWLTPDWPAVQAGGADRTENQLGATGGGNGTDVLEWLSKGMAAPAEQYFPYSSTGFTLPYAWNDPHWQSQYNSNTWNLDPAHLPRTALRAPGYYYATGFQRLSQANSTSLLESYLDAGFEVVWDFHVAGDRSGPIWRASSAASIGGHSMLIIGYDRSSSDPNDHHFICKNSWGDTEHPNDWTWIGYDYIQYGYSAACLLSVAPNPKPWPELELLGRRTISYDGWPGTLDIYHLPGINQMYLDRLQNGVIDRRVGTFYDHNGTAHRVNGFVYGRTLHFWFKASNRNMRWDEERETPTLGRSFIYSLVGNDGLELAGRHHDNAGLTPNPPYGGYARMPSTMLANDGRMNPATPSNTGQPEQYLGSWRMRAGNAERFVRLTHRDDSLLPFQQQWTYAALAGHVRINSATTVPIMLRVHKNSPRTIELSYTDPQFGLVDIEGWMLNWQQGIVAGLGEVDQVINEAFYMVRDGDYSVGTQSSFGSACGPANGQPYHTVGGLSEASQLMWFECDNLQPNDIALLALGLSKVSSGGTPLPLSLAGIGMPGCNLYVDPVQLVVDIADYTGLAQVVTAFPQPALIGQHLYSQYFVLAPGANPAGILASNAVDQLVGGVW